MAETMTWIGVVLEVDCTTHAIVAADATFITDLARDFLRRTIIGYKLTDGLEGLLKLVDRKMHTPSKHALQVALQAAFQRYVEFRQSGKG